MGLPSDVRTRVKVARVDWDRAYADHTAAQQTAAVARRAKEDRRRDCDRLIREVVRRVKAHVSVTASVAESAINNRQSAIGMARTSAKAEFTGPDVGQTAHYMVRWLSPGAPGRRSRPPERNGQRDDWGVEAVSY